MALEGFLNWNSGSSLEDCWPSTALPQVPGPAGGPLVAARWRWCTESPGPGARPELSAATAATVSSCEDKLSAISDKSWPDSKHQVL